MAEENTKGSALRVAKSLEAHSMIAILFGGLIYILAVTGTLSVFNREFQRWEQPTAPEMQAISPEAAERAATSVFLSEENPTTHLYINFPQEDLPRTIITTDTQAFFANGDGTIAGKEDFPWTQFLLDLHYYLHMPTYLGLTVVGALGALLLGLSISGILAHPRIFRDAFSFRRNAGQLTKVDLHNRLSVWTLPFHFSNALTGAILGLASILAFAIATAGFEGKTEDVFAPIFGSEDAPDMTAAPMASIAKPLHHMAHEHPDIHVTYFILHDPQTAGQHANVIGKHSDRLIFGEYYNFTANGEYEGNVGISDGTVGQQITGALYNVHFGNWGGLPVKLAYLLFGIALSVIIASGLNIYFGKRRSRGDAVPKLEGAWTAVIWGVPVTLAATMVAAITGIVSGLGLVAIFWLGTVILIAVGTRLGKERMRTVCFGLFTTFMLAGLIGHAVRYGSAAWGSAGLAVTVSGILIVCGSSFCFWSGRKARRAA